MKRGWGSSGQSIKEDAGDGGMYKGLLNHSVEIELSDVLLVGVSRMWWQGDEYWNVALSNGGCYGGGVSDGGGWRWRGTLEW